MRYAHSREADKDIYYADAVDQYTGMREGVRRPISSWPAGARVEVTRGKQVPTFNFDRNPSTGIDHGADNPSELFYNIPSEISNIQADSSMRLPAMTLVSRAMLDHPGLVPGSSVTRQAAPLAKKAIDKGLLSPNPANPQTEVRSSRPTRRYSNREESAWANELPAADVQRARGYMRASLGRKSNKLSTAQFQPQLPIFQQPPVPGM